MRQEVHKIREENLLLRQAADLRSQQALARGFQSDSQACTRSKTADQPAQDRDKPRGHVSELTHGLQTDKPTHPTHPGPRRHLIDAKRSAGQTQAGRKGASDQLSHLRCYAAPSLKSSKHSELKATDSGFLSRSRESLDFASGNPKASSTLKEKVVIPKLNTQAILDQQRKPSGCSQQQQASDLKFTSSQPEDRSDSLCISDKLSELAANHLDFVCSLDSADEASKKNLICDYLDIN